MPPALAGRFLPTTPPGKSCASFSLVFCQSSTNYVCISKQYVHYISMFGNFFLQWNYASMYHCVTCSLRLSFFAVSAVFNYFSLLFCIVFDYIWIYLRFTGLHLTVWAFVFPLPLILSDYKQWSGGVGGRLKREGIYICMLLLLLSRFSRVQLCATP